MSVNSINLFGSIMYGIEGKITLEKSMKSITWLRVGGAAEVFFQPLDVYDLCRFLRLLPEVTTILPIGVCSNLLVRDGGIPGVTIRLGRGFSDIDIDGCYVTVGGAVLDARIADFSAQKGVDLSFLKTIPGSIGGAVKMNAGCYGTCLADVFVSCDIVTRAGYIKTLKGSDLSFSYRKSNLMNDSIVTKVILKGNKGIPENIKANMKKNQQKRIETQPIRDKTGGSTFKNPTVAHMQSGHLMSAWQLIDKANLRGRKFGGAQVSELHSNFLINTGLAEAEDFEALGELIQKSVYLESGINLEWEIKKVGNRIQEITETSLMSVD